MNKSQILVVDDDEAHRNMLRMMLRSWDYEVDTASDGSEALNYIQEKFYDAVLTDVRMAKVNGIETLKGILSYNPALPVLLMTAYSSVETAVDALRLGAYDYLIKPLDFDALKHSLKQAIEHSRLCIENKELKRQLLEADHGQEILGRSHCIEDLRGIINTVAPTEATVLITGESGCGKELVARAIHRGSHRANKQLITVNCAALAETLLESELFGHEKGAFTGANKRREGMFAQADTGTIFLDEIGEMPLSVQAKLLRTLQDGEIQRPGSDTPLHIDVRVLAATNRNLRHEVSQGRFREDLWFRLNVISIEVPPLRARREDIPALAAAFLQNYAKKNNKNIRGFAPQVLNALLRYHWPGNVRELENIIERAVILCTGDLISGPELPAEFRKYETEFSDNLNGNLGEKLNENLENTHNFGNISLEELEKRAISATLKEVAENKSEAARRLGITRATLHSKMRKYGLE